MEKIRQISKTIQVIITEIVAILIIAYGALGVLELFLNKLIEVF